jgi:hypothetical protein
MMKLAVPELPSQIAHPILGYMTVAASPLQQYSRVKSVQNPVFLR